MNTYSQLQFISTPNQRVNDPGRLSDPLSVRDLRAYPGGPNLGECLSWSFSCPDPFRTFFMFITWLVMVSGLAPQVFSPCWSAWNHLFHLAQVSNGNQFVLPLVQDFRIITFIFITIAGPKLIFFLSKMGIIT